MNNKKSSVLILPEFSILNQPTTIISIVPDGTRQSLETKMVVPPIQDSGLNLAKKIFKDSYNIISVFQTVPNPDRTITTTTILLFVKTLPLITSIRVTMITSGSQLSVRTLTSLVAEKLENPGNPSIISYGPIERFKNEIVRFNPIDIEGYVVLGDILINSDASVEIKLSVLNGTVIYYFFKLMPSLKLAIIPIIFQFVSDNNVNNINTSINNFIDINNTINRRISPIFTYNKNCVIISSNDKFNDGSRILIKSMTDFYGGSNLAQVILIIEDNIPHKIINCNDKINKHLDKYLSSYSRYPNITPLVIGNECTLVDKIIAINDQYYNGKSNPQNILARLVLYAMLRYFLGSLLYGYFNTDILARKYTEMFYYDLSISRYSNFMDAFLDPAIHGFDKFFIYSYNTNRCYI